MLLLCRSTGPGEGDSSMGDTSPMPTLSSNPAAMPGGVTWSFGNTKGTACSGSDRPDAPGCSPPAIAPGAWGVVNGASLPGPSVSMASSAPAPPGPDPPGASTNVAAPSGIDACEGGPYRSPVMDARRAFCRSSSGASAGGSMREMNASGSLPCSHSTTSELPADSYLGSRRAAYSAATANAGGHCAPTHTYSCVGVCTMKAPRGSSSRHVCVGNFLGGVTVRGTSSSGACAQWGEMRYMRVRAGGACRRFCHCSSWQVKPMLGLAMPRMPLTRANTSS
mmetsp:Transcript_22971/g.58740  ORF Transcript_22971/g.58740 Transcript_22971/m.58740 type:complete len:279 (-) Transcript_22971:674-1510(-)